MQNTVTQRIDSGKPTDIFEETLRVNEESCSDDTTPRQSECSRPAASAADGTCLLDPPVADLKNEEIYTPELTLQPTNQSNHAAEVHAIEGDGDVFTDAKGFKRKKVYHQGDKVEVRWGGKWEKAEVDRVEMGGGIVVVSWGWSTKSPSAQQVGTTHDKKSTSTIIGAANVSKRRGAVASVRRLDHVDEKDVRVPSAPGEGKKSRRPTPLVRDDLEDDNANSTPSPTVANVDSDHQPSNHRDAFPLTHVSPTPPPVSCPIGDIASEADAQQSSCPHPLSFRFNWKVVSEVESSTIGVEGGGNNSATLTQSLRRVLENTYIAMLGGESTVLSADVHLDHCEFLSSMLTNVFGAAGVYFYDKELRRPNVKEGRTSWPSPRPSLQTTAETIVSVKSTSRTLLSSLCTAVPTLIQDPLQTRVLILGMPENEEEAKAGKESTVKEEESYCSMVPLPPTQVGSSSANGSKCSLRTQLRYDLLCVKALGLTPLDADGLLPLLLTPQVSQSASSTKVSRSLITGLTWSIDRVLNECVVEATISLPSSFLGTNMSTRADDASIEVNQLSRGTLAPSPMRPESRNQTPLLFGNNKERLGRFLSNSPSVSADESVLRGGHTEQQLLLPRLMALVQQRRVEESDDNIRNDLAPSNLSMALAVAYLDAVTPKLLGDRALSGCAIWLPSLIGKTIVEGPTRTKQVQSSFVPATQHPSNSVADIGGRSLFVPATQEGPCPPSMPVTTIDDPSSDVMLLKGTVPSTYGPHSSLFPLPLGTQLPNVNTVPTNIPSAFPQFAERLRFVLQLAGANTIMGNHCEIIAEFGDALRDEISLVVGHDLVGAKRRKVFVVDTVSLLEGFLLTTIPTRVPSQSTHPKDKKSGGERKVGSQHHLHADFDRFLEGLNLRDGESTTSHSQLVQQRVIQYVATNVSSLAAQPLVSLSPSSVVLGPSANPPPAAAKINSEHFLIKSASDLVVQQQRHSNSTDRQPSARPISFKIIGVDWLVHRLLSGPPSAEADLTTPPQCLLQAFEEAQQRDVDAQPPLSETIETLGIADDNTNVIETPSAAEKCIEEQSSFSERRKSQQNSQQSVRSNFSLSQTSVAGSASSGHAMRKKSAAREALAPLIVPQSLPSSSSATEDKSTFREQQHTHQQEEELTVGLAQDPLDIHPGQSESSMGSALLPAHPPPDAAEQRSLIRQESSSIHLPDPSPEYVTKDSVAVLASRLSCADEEQRVDPIALNNQEGLGLNNDIDQPVVHMFTHSSVEVPIGDSARSVIVSIGDDFYAAQPSDDVGSGSEEEGDEVVLGRVELIEEELLLGAPEGRALTATIDVEDNKAVVLSRSFWVTLRLYDITTVFVSKRSSNRTRGSAAAIRGNDVSPSSKRQREEDGVFDVDGREAPRKVLVGEEAFITPHGNHQPRLLVPSSASPVVRTPSVSIRRRPKVSLSAYRTTRVPIEALDVTTPVFILEEHLLQHVYVLSLPHPTSASPTAEAHVVSNQLHPQKPNMPSSAASNQVDDTNSAPALQRLESFQSGRMTGRAVLYSAGTSPIGRHAFRPLSSDSVTNTYGDPPTVETPGGVPTVQQHSTPSLFGVGGVTPNRYVTPSSYITRLPGTPY